MVRIEIPELALVVLVGPAGAGKTTFARARFKPTEVVSSDFLRGLIADNEADLSATHSAFHVLHMIAGLRLQRRRLTVVDAVNARPTDRRPLIALAREHDCAAVAIVFDLPEDLCVARDRARSDRSVGARVIRTQRQAVKQSLAALGDEGFDAVHVLSTAEAVEEVVLRRVQLSVNRRWERGPFDVVGDVHGCMTELVELLQLLGYRVEKGRDGEAVVGEHQAGRKVVFCGDLVGQGPQSAGVVRLVMRMAAGKTALSVRGDQDDELVRAGSAQLWDAGVTFLDSLPSHYVLSSGALVVTHAAILPQMLGRDSARVRALCLGGQPGWKQGWRGRALVVHGHQPVEWPQWEGRTLDLDTGCVNGGRLSALHYPELEIVSVRGTTRP